MLRTVCARSMSRPHLYRVAKMTVNGKTVFKCAVHSPRTFNCTLCRCLFYNSGLRSSGMGAGRNENRGNCVKCMSGKALN